MQSILTNLLLPISLIFMLALSGCMQPDALQSPQMEGIITGEDQRRCVCCGGWFVDIQNETHRFTRLPDGSDLNLQSYPVEVVLEWEVDPNACLGDEILVHSIEEK
ncbi:MAG: hypothetical protein AAF587_31295 [Bacteroidota bacterium]